MVPNALNFFLMTEDDLKFGIRYLQWLLYRARSFVLVSKVPTRRLRRSRPLQKQHGLKHTLQNSSTIIDTEEDQEGRNEGNAEGGYANKEHLTMVLPFKGLEETRWKSMYCNIIVKSHLMLSRFLGSEKLSNIL